MVDLVVYCERVPLAGETLVGRSFTIGFGGKGANQAVMASRLGSDVAIVNCLGDDVFGRMIMENLRAERINVDHVITLAGESSGVAPIWVEEDGTNRIIIVPGANRRVDPERAAQVISQAATVDVVVGQMEIPQMATVAAFQAARRRGATTVLNPAPAEPLLPELTEATDWCIPNEGEFAEIARSAVGRACDPMNVEDLQAVTHALGTRLVVTLGAHGACYLRGSGTLALVEPPRVTAVDTTGAGDAFVGAFAHAIGLGRDVGTAVRLASACAASSVQRPGTQASYPTGEDLEAVALWARNRVPGGDQLPAGKGPPKR
jgi:ribokinase